MTSASAEGAAKRDGVRIEAAAPLHAGAIARLHGELIDPPWSPDGVAATLANPATLVLAAVAADGDAVVGFVIAQVMADEAEILAIGVVPAMRKQGLARRLLEVAEEGARQRGAARMFLEVASDNVAAQRLYSAAGYSITGNRADYYRRKDGTAANAVILSRSL